MDGAVDDDHMDNKVQFQPAKGGRSLAPSWHPEGAKAPGFIQVCKGLPSVHVYEKSLYIKDLCG